MFDVRMRIWALIWAQGARDGDPRFSFRLSSCIRVPVMKCLHDTIVQSYLTSVRVSLCGLRTRTRREATMALETWIMVGDAGGIEPACTHAPDGARPHGERKDALDTVA